MYDGFLDAYYSVNDSSELISDDNLYILYSKLKILV